jgi:nitrate/nitrite-specific signal transduction histidine kinase
LTSENAPQWILCYSASESLLLAPSRKRLYINLLITLGVILVIMVPTIFFAMAVARPLEALTRIADATGRLELDSIPPLPESSIYEVDQLARATKSMRSGLQSFLRYIPTDLLHRYLRPGSTAQIDGELVHLTVLFSTSRIFHQSRKTCNRSHSCGN